MPIQRYSFGTQKPDRDSEGEFMRYEDVADLTRRLATAERQRDEAADLLRQVADITAADFPKSLTGPIRRWLSREALALIGIWPPLAHKSEI